MGLKSTVHLEKGRNEDSRLLSDRVMSCGVFPRDSIAMSRNSSEMHTQACTAYVLFQKWDGGGKYYEES